ncbi:hypothetical protein [Solimonas sp. SE-A11]|uniref:hypothetical protein n=1 Tax=Solimonas sp. SE-A11 TaxID=3054954 RepID=UPI00259C9DDC|nr:hypothetical protein [Solimonas sp. SE-A11]MDM4769773.1 hypothetical protein [Solimonas sp. SE-A11]
MHTVLSAARALAAGLLLALVAACDRAPPAPGPAGGLEVEGGSLSFTAVQGQGVPPAPQTLAVRVDKDQAQRIGTGPALGETADWFAARIDGAPPDLKLVVSITRTTLPPGDYKARLEVATGDAQQNFLQSRPVELNYRVLLKP